MVELRTGVGRGKSRRKWRGPGVLFKVPPEVNGSLKWWSDRIQFTYFRCHFHSTYIQYCMQARRETENPVSGLACGYVDKNRDRKRWSDSGCISENQLTLNLSTN